MPMQPSAETEEVFSRAVAAATEPELHDRDGAAPDGLADVLELLGRTYRIDFREYKKGTLARRTERRMALHRIASWPDYLALLSERPDEVAALYRDMLIGVTRFFRDPEEWAELEAKILPQLVEGHPPEVPVRVWSAGCATGEEAYSLAMTLLEQLERVGSRAKLQVFASDLSLDALAFARRGLYPEAIEASVSPARLKRFFRRVGEGYEVTRTLRDVVTFAAHDLLGDPPFSQLDLVSCRNVMIYLETSAQQRVLEVLHFALRREAVLWLGSAEAVGRRPDLFGEISSQGHFYRAIGASRPDRYRARHLHAARVRGGPTGGSGAPPKGHKTSRALEKLVLAHHTAACAVISQGFEILYLFGPTQEYLSAPRGEARMDLLAWAEPGLYAKLRTGLLEAVERRAKVAVRGMRVGGHESARRLVDVTIEPILGVSGAEGLYLVVFQDTTSTRERPSEAREPSAPPEQGKVERLQRELDDTRQELSVAVEQLKTASEEYHASNEELLSLNEEFQSSNEELETSKEELQSLNEELTTINRQLEERNADLRLLTTDLNNFLVSTSMPIVFLDHDLRIRRFTPACASVMHLVPTDIGRPLADIKLDVEDPRVLEDAARALREEVSSDVEVPTLDGRWFSRKTLAYRSTPDHVEGVCIAYLDITAQKDAVAASEDARSFAEGIIRTSRTPLLVLDGELRVVAANAAFYETFRTNEEGTVGHKIYELGNHQWDIPRLRSLLETLPAERLVRDYAVDYVFEDIGWRSMRLNADFMVRAGRPNLVLVSIEDVTDLRKAEMAAQRRAEELLEDHRRKDEFLAMLGHELRNPVAALANALDLMKLVSADPERVAQLQEMMARQTRRMTAMLDQLLEVARVISGKLALSHEAVDMAEAVRSAVETVSPMIATRKHELAVSLPPERTALVLGDPVRLAQVVENLLTNAAKYTDPGGRIWLTVETTADLVRLSVRDTGIGIEPGVLAHIFDLFTQAPGNLDRAGGGLGLGLSLVRSLVELHGGRVEAKSGGLGKGSELVVFLPLLRAGRVTPRRHGIAPDSRFLSRRVLVVDDEEDAATPLVEVLRIKGHDARAALDGPAALLAAREFQPDIMLLDLGLPGMDGYQVARSVRDEHGAALRVIAMTGYQRDTERLEQAGFDGHLLKPVDLSKLESLLAKVPLRPRA